MAKAIYCLKIYLFKKQFNLKKSEVTGLRHICLFIVEFHVKSWFNAIIAILAPNQDLQLLQNLIKYRSINAQVAEAASVKLRGHLWYLSEHLVGLSFFDKSVSHQTKLKMVKAIKEREGAKMVLKRIEIKQTEYQSLLEKDISDFVTTNSLFLFKQYQLPYGFLDISPELWEKDASFNECLKVFSDLKVVNDCVERGVALMQEFNLLLTKDEDQKQFALQVVSHHMKRFPDCHKKNLK